MVEYYWSRIVGKFVDKCTGEEMCLFPDGRRMCTFTGTVREWYETFVEVIFDVSNTLLRQGVPVETVHNIRLVANPNVAIMAERTVLYGTRLGDGVYLSIDHDENMGASVDFVNRETGEVLGIVHVLDMNPCLDV